MNNLRKSYEYLLCLKAFSRSAYYIVSAHEDNYLHLTGVHTNFDDVVLQEGETCDKMYASVDTIKELNNSVVRRSISR